jgi:hypothetical protein
MAKEKAVGQDNSFPQKHLKRLDQPFIDAVDQMNTDEIKARIITCEGNLFDIAGAKDADTKLAETKEMVKELAAPYRDGKNDITARLQYCIYVLQQRGVELS